MAATIERIQQLTEEVRGYESALRSAYRESHGRDTSRDLSAEDAIHHIADGCPDCERAFQERKQRLQEFKDPQWPRRRSK